MGLDPGFSHFHVHSSFSSRNLRMLPYRWWSLLLVRNDGNEGMGTSGILGDWRKCIAVI